jgi:endonuclease/exonuclease/phosphatase family metal-dependent hydrolase
MKIKIATYNIHRAIGLDRRFRPQRIIDILNEINADVVLLQEVDDGVPRSLELNLAEEISTACDFPYFKLAHNVTLKKGFYGNATLTKFPITQQRNIDLTIGNKKRRGCLYTQLEIEKNDEPKHLDLFNLHLGLSAKERQKQAGLIFRSNEFCKIDESTPCIVAGDFNDWRSMLRALFIEGMGFKCATDKNLMMREVAIKTFPSFAPRGGLDRVYYKGDLKFLNVYRYKKKIAKIASDHLPVITEFSI